MSTLTAQNRKPGRDDRDFHYFHVYDFRVKPGRGDEFVELFNKFDYGDNNPFHRSGAQYNHPVGRRRLR